MLNRHITFLILMIVLPFITLADASIKSEPINNGYAYSHQSEIMSEARRYMVSLPERYYGNERRYPSLYIIDADFQFQHVSAVVKNLARMGKIPPMIVVGVANQGSPDYLKTTTWPDKKDDAFGGAEQFHSYLSNELVPQIDRQFRTNEKKALSGYSLGGLFTLYNMMQEDTPFNAFLAMSPSAWFDDNSLPKKLTPLLRSGKLNAPVFISLAREEEMGVDTVVAAFEQHAPEHLLWQYKHYPDENHFTTALPALYDGLQFLAPNYAVDGTDMLEIGDYKQVLAHFYRQKGNWGGFQFEWLHAYQFAKYMFWSKQLDKVDAVIAAIEHQFPESLTMVSVQLAKGFNKKEQPERVAKLLQHVKNEGQYLPDWHKEMANYYKLTHQLELAQQYQKKAVELAKKYHYESWEVWELK